MNLHFDPALYTLPGELPAQVSETAVPALFDEELDLQSSGNAPVRASFGVGPAFVPAFQWEDDDEEDEYAADDDEIDIEDDDLEEEWEEEEFDIDEEDFEMDEEEDVDFGPYEEGGEDYFADEPEDRGHQVADRNPSPCNPAYAVEARRELI